MTGRPRSLANCRKARCEAKLALGSKHRRVVATPLRNNVHRHAGIEQQSFMGAAQIVQAQAPETELLDSCPGIPW
jgi:hypothetical protein